MARKGKWLVAILKAGVEISFKWDKRFMEAKSVLTSKSEPVSLCGRVLRVHCGPGTPSAAPGPLTSSLASFHHFTREGAESGQTIC